MRKKLSIAAFIGVLSLAVLPAASFAQGTGTEPPKAPTPTEAAKGGAMMKPAAKGAMKPAAKGAMKPAAKGAMMKPAAKGGMKPAMKPAMKKM